MDHNSNHIIQKCFEVFPFNKIEFILNVLIMEVNYKLIIRQIDCWQILMAAESYKKLLNSVQAKK